MTGAASAANGGSSSHAEPKILESFLWGLLSASSLNIGSIIGVTCLPSKKVRAMFMAFGGGALLFALSVELFGHSLHRFDATNEYASVASMEGAAVFGGLLFALLNRLLNSAGADVRKPSTRMGTVSRMRGLLMRRLIQRLSKVHFFSMLSYGELTRLIATAMYKERFGPGDVIMSQSQDAGIYFIISGSVHVQVRDSESRSNHALHIRGLGSPKSKELCPMLESIQEDVDTESHDCETQARPHLINLDDSDTEEAHDSCGDDTDQLPKDVSNTQDCLQSWDLGPNQIFGDMTILTGSPHIGAEAHASVATKVLVLPRHEVTRLLAINSSVREFASEEAVRQLKEVEELKHLPEHCLAALSARSSHRRFEPGDYIFKGTVDDRTPLICIILGSVERIYHKSTKSEILQPGSVLCTEQLKGKSSKAFTAVAVGQTSVLFLQRSVIDEVSKMSMHSLGDSLGWNGAVSNDDSFSKKTRFWKIYDSKKKDRAHGGSGSDDDATDGGTVLSTITDEEIADVHGASFDEPPMDPWMAAMMNVMQNVHERAMTEKGMSKRQERKEQEARVEKRVSELRAKASRTALNEDGKTQAPSGVATTKVEDSKEAAKNSDAGGHGHGHGGASAKHQAIMVWLGILIDAVPESLVIGILVNKSVADGTSSASVALPFVISVFLSNLPESMSSSGSMKNHGMRVSYILLMWFLTTFITALGALLGAVIFQPESIHDQDTEIIVSIVEGVAAGAMLTMIAQTMMPEAFEQGGDVVGLSCLAGFLCSMSVKLIPT